MVSVLVPVYNMERYLPKCIESILRQTRTDFELVLCDDGATDQSGLICDEYAQKDRRVCVIHKQNEGIMRAREVLLHRAAGKYVFFVDADDWIVPTLLEETLNCAEKTGSDVVMFEYTQTTDAGEARRRQDALYPDGTVFEGEGRTRLYERFACGNALNHLWDKLIARDLFFCEYERNSNHHIYQTGEDKFLLFPVFAWAKRLCYLSRPLYFYRQSATGMGRNIKLSCYWDVLEMNRENLGFLRHMDIDSKKNQKACFRHTRRTVAKLTECIVHGGAYGCGEMKNAFARVREHPEYRRAVGAVWMPCGHLLDWMVLLLFQLGWFDLLIIALRIERKTLDMIRSAKKEQRAADSWFGGNEKC